MLGLNKLILAFTVIAIATIPAASAFGCVVNVQETILHNGFEPCPRDQSAFVQLNTDVMVDSTISTPILSKSINLSQPARIIAVADGRYFPFDAPAGSLRIAINGNESNSTKAITDWGSSNKPVQHSFNVISEADLQPGQHSIALMASALVTRPGRFKVGSGSALSIFVAPRSTTVISSLSGESNQINLTTYNPQQGIDTVEGGANRPSMTILAHQAINDESSDVFVVSMLSGRAFHACNSGINGGRGDALWGIWKNDACQRTSNASWSVNDIDVGAEMTAPMYAHAFHTLNPGQAATISFRASELAFGSDQANYPSGAHENGVCYKAGSAKLLSAISNSVIGSATTGPDAPCSTYTWRCIGSTQNHPGCPVAGSTVVLASTNVSIPDWHDGTVFFSAKTRIQADNADGFSTVTLGIRVDGNQLGSVGVQQLADGAGQASRTLSASYLSAAGTSSTRLLPGNHVVEVFVRIEGNNIKHASVPQELVLTYFD